MAPVNKGSVLPANHTFTYKCNEWPPSLFPSRRAPPHFGL